MKDYIKLVFKTDMNKNLSLRVSNPYPLVTDEEVDTAMDEIIASHAVKGTSGKAVAKGSASMITYSKTPITITV